MSRLHTGNHAFVSLRYCYHGGAGIAHDITSLGNWKFHLPNVSGFEKVIPLIPLIILGSSMLLI